MRQIGMVGAKVPIVSRSCQREGRDLVRCLPLGVAAGDEDDLLGSLEHVGCGGDDGRGVSTDACHSVSPDFHQIRPHLHWCFDGRPGTGN